MGNTSPKLLSFKQMHLLAKEYSQNPDNDVKPASFVNEATYNLFKSIGYDVAHYVINELIPDYAVVEANRPTYIQAHVEFLTPSTL